MRHAFEHQGTEHEIWLGRDARGELRLHALGREVPVRLTLDADGAGTLAVEDASWPLVLVQRGDEVFVHLEGVNHRMRLRYPLERASAESHAGADDQVRAPMPGTVISVAVAPGAVVPRGAPLLVMESMKLETTLTAPRDATVREVHVAPGRAFDRDAVLVSLEPPEAA